MTHFSHDYEQGIKDEQERIIKLLDSRILPSGNPDVHSYDSLHNLMIRNLISVIKREQK